MKAATFKQAPGSCGGPQPPVPPSGPGNQPCSYCIRSSQLDNVSVCDKCSHKPCPSSLSIPVISIRTKSNLGWKGCYFSIQLQSILRGSQGRNSEARIWRQELKQGSRRNAAYWFAQSASLEHPGPPAHGQQPPTMRWAVPQQPLIKKTSSQTCRQII